MVDFFGFGRKQILGFGRKNVVGCGQIMRFLAAEFGSDIYVHLMNQYEPAGKVGGHKYPELQTRVTRHEMAEARRIAQEEGITRLDRRRPHPRLMLS